MSMLPPKPLKSVLKSPEEVRRETTPNKTVRFNIPEKDKLLSSQSKLFKSLRENSPRSRRNKSLKPPLVPRISSPTSAHRRRLMLEGIANNSPSPIRNFGQRNDATTPMSPTGQQTRFTSYQSPPVRRSARFKRTRPSREILEGFAGKMKNKRLGKYVMSLQEEKEERNVSKQPEQLDQPEQLVHQEQLGEEGETDFRDVNDENSLSVLNVMSSPKRQKIAKNSPNILMPEVEVPNSHQNICPLASNPTVDRSIVTNFNTLELFAELPGDTSKTVEEPPGSSQEPPGSSQVVPSVCVSSSSSSSVNKSTDLKSMKQKIFRKTVCLERQENSKRTRCEFEINGKVLTVRRITSIERTVTTPFDSVEDAIDVVRSRCEQQKERGFEIIRDVNQAEGEEKLCLEINNDIVAGNLELSDLEAQKMNIERELKF